MAIPASLQNGLKLPVIAAPMFLVSGPDLVVEACNAGVIGTFPSLNQRTTEGYRAWLAAGGSEFKSAMLSTQWKDPAFRTACLARSRRA